MYLADLSRSPHRKLAGGALLLALLVACTPTEEQEPPPPSNDPGGGAQFTCANACQKAVTTCGIPPLDVAACTTYCNSLSASERNLECFRTANCSEIQSGKCAGGIPQTGTPFTCADACKKSVETCGIPPADVAGCTSYCNSLPESSRNLDCFKASTCEEIKGGKCAQACTPHCQDKVCGDDGCGGSCGSCGSGSTCVEGQCRLDCPQGSSPQGGVCVCDPGYIKGEDCGGCVLDPENDGCPANATRVNGQCTCGQGYMLNEAGCGCVPLPTCTTLYTCGYEHVHYPDGSGVSYNQFTWLDRVETQQSALQACLDRERYGKISTVPPDERCLFQGCMVAFSNTHCAGANFFTCRYRHQHYDDGSGVVVLEKTSTSLMNSQQGAYDNCVNYLMYGKKTELPPQEACKLIECTVSG